MAVVPPIVHKYERIYEAVSWGVILVVLFAIRFFPAKIIEADTFYLILGIVLSALILYYYLVWKKFPRTKRFYIKDIADVILLGILIHFAKDLGIYFFSLFLFPIVAAALTLDVFSSILIVLLACAIVAAETILGAQGNPPQYYMGFWQIITILIMTIFSRFLALEVRHRREAEEEARIKAFQLEEAEKLRKEFVALTAHQLFTPLSIIRGFISLLHSGDLGKIPPKQKGPVSEIYENTKKMIHLVSELLSVSRLEREKLPMEIREINILNLIQKSVSMMKPQAEAKKLYLRFKKPAQEIPKIKLDPDKIEQVLYSLIDNGIKYTKEGGVEVGVKRENNKAIVVSVSDTGVGIPSEYEDRLFQPFFRGKNILELDKKGTGLGLFISKTLVEKHGGKIWAKSQEGKGSTFYFSLPFGYIK